jgi:formate hydrogenlyase subunit 3/multisubunit Na+/H+ antiporter MnhD subunit
LGFDSLIAYFNTKNTFPLFLLFFIGFGIKAGFIPLHTWLPHAHPAAPSHISGIMSGVIIKMGIYGILRVLTYIHHDLLAVGLIILIVSVISGILGVVIAIVQHDFKKLLAYHSIENIGIIGIGIGAGTIGLALNLPVLASLGFAGGLLHIFNHSLFKSLLFYSAGSVYQQTHTRNIDHLGGLMKKMPKTAMFFLLGALAISGLPPFNGFISEFLIYSGLFKSLMHNNLLISFLLLGGIVSLVVIGGLAVFCFTKIFSIIFLGNPRSDKTDMASEVKSGMLVPKYVIAILIILIGMVPLIIIEPLSRIVSVYVNDIDALNQMKSPFESISASFSVFILIISVLIIVKLRISKKREIITDNTWGCGYTGANPALHQYTATSYSGYIEKKAKLIVGVKKHFIPIEKDEIFPSPSEFKTESLDVFEHNLVQKPIDKLLKLMDKMAIFQTGNIQDYLLYAILFVIFISLITVLNFI